jgi:hypothetical protein
MKLRPEVESLTSVKKLRIDNRTHTITLLEGEPRLFGKDLGTDRSVGPEDLLTSMHPEDVEPMLVAFENSVFLDPESMVELKFRVRHEDGFWLSVKLEVTPETYDSAGKVLTALAYMESVPTE